VDQAGIDLMRQLTEEIEAADGDAFSKVGQILGLGLTVAAVFRFAVLDHWTDLQANFDLFYTMGGLAAAMYWVLIGPAPWFAAARLRAASPASCSLRRFAWTERRLLLFPAAVTTALGVAVFNLKGGPDAVALVLLGVPIAEFVGVALAWFCIERFPKSGKRDLDSQKTRTAIGMLLGYPLAVLLRDGLIALVALLLPTDSHGYDWTGTLALNILVPFLGIVALFHIMVIVLNLMGRKDLDSLRRLRLALATGSKTAPQAMAEYLALKKKEFGAT
jgi:hypothetical protein